MKEKLKKLFREIKAETFIGAATVIILGILLLLGVETLICQIVGVVSLVIGAFFLLMYFINIFRHTRISSQLLYAIGTLTVGFIFYFQNQVIVNLLSLVFAVVLILDGAVKLDSAIHLFERKNKLVAFFILAFSIAALAVGFLILMGKISAMNIIGYILIWDGILDIITILMISAKVRKTLR